MAAVKEPARAGTMHTFIQFGAVVAVHDTRGQEELVDRAEVGRPVSRTGPPVTSISLDGGWFAIAAGGRTYWVPVANVRSARRV